MENLQIILPNDINNDSFPDNFNVSFKLNGQNTNKQFQIYKTKIGHLTLNNSLDVYTINSETKRAEKFDLNDEEANFIIKALSWIFC